MAKAPSARSAQFARPLLPALALMLMWAPGCGRKIGDECARAFDCSTTQRRQCDLSNARRDPSGKGECTIENCTRNGCPSEAVCVKTYPTEFLSLACSPELEDLDGVTNACRPHEICVPEGLCADELASRSSCRLECTKDSNCRDGYECRALGQDGMYRAPSPAVPTLGGGKSICVPKP